MRLPEVVTTLIRFRTEAGSIYAIVRDDGGLRWLRESASRDSGVLPTEGAALEHLPVVVIGERVRLESPWGAAGYRDVVMTSRVVEVLDDEAPPLPVGHAARGGRP